MFVQEQKERKQLKIHSNWKWGKRPGLLEQCILGLSLKENGGEGGKKVILS